MGNSVSYALSLLIIILASLTSCQKGSLDSEIGRQILALNPSTNSQASCVVYRLEDSYPGSDEAKKEKYLHGYSIHSGPIDLEYRESKRSSFNNREKKTYIEHAVPVDCSFLPGVAFRFNDNQNRLDLLVCFTCSELRYYLNGGVFWQSYFNPNELKDFVKKLYPKTQKFSHSIELCVIALLAGRDFEMHFSWLDLCP